MGRFVVLSITLTIVLLAVPFAARPQAAAKVPRVGVLQVGGGVAATPLFEALKQGMRERGYVEGRTVVFEYRQGHNDRERLAGAAAELVRLKVDIIVTSTDEGIAAVKRQTRTIPIVMANSTDPVGTGFVASLARPGGNITGHSSMSPELSGKRVELLREVLPAVSRIAILWNPEVRGAVLDYKETESAARSLRLSLQSVELSHADDIERGFETLTSGRAEAVVVPAINPVAFSNRHQIAALAQKHRLPTIFGTKDYADVGGLMAYGPNVNGLWRHAATYVDKILKGAKPGDLPVEQPSSFELVINQKTAKALGLTFPASLLRRADHVIE